ASNIQPNVTTFMYMITGFYKSNDITKAEEWIEKLLESKMRLSIASFNTLIAEICNTGNMQKAEETVDRFVNEKLAVPNVVTFGLLMNGFCTAGKPDKAKELFSKMLK